MSATLNPAGAGGNLVRLDAGPEQFGDFVSGGSELMPEIEAALAAKRLLRYVAGTSNTKLDLTPDSEACEQGLQNLPPFEVYADASFAPVANRSPVWMMAFWCGACVAWRASRPPPHFA